MTAHTTNLELVKIKNRLAVSLRKRPTFRDGTKGFLVK